MSFRIECSRSDAREETHSTIPRINDELCIAVDIGAWLGCLRDEKALSAKPRWETGLAHMKTRFMHKFTTIAFTTRPTLGYQLNGFY